MADVFVASVLVVEIVSALVQLPSVAATKMDVGMTPPTEGGPMIQQDMSGRPAQDS